MKLSLTLSIYSLFIFNSFGQITSGLIAHFPFNGNVSDQSTSSVNATNNNCGFVNGITAQANTAIDFDNNGFVSFTGNTLKVQFPITVSYWLKLNSLNDVNIIFKTDNVFSDYHGVWMNNLPSGQISLCFGGGNGVANTTNQRYYTSDLTISAGTWHHIVGIIRDYNDMDIYIDCVQANGNYGGTGPTTVAYSGSGNTRIGGSIGTAVHASDFYTDGQMDDFGFWNRELNTNELTFLCNQSNALDIEQISNENSRELIRIVDLMGRETQFVFNTTLIYQYSDGSSEKVFLLQE